MRCDQCTHWNGEADFLEAKKAGFGLCNGIRERWVIEDEVSTERGRYENSDAYYEARNEAIKQARAYCEDGSEYKAIVLTALDFFCALFTLKGE